jgi:hypothetical protein
MRKDIGNKNKQARDQAVTALQQLRGTNVKNLKTNEVRDVLLIVMQLLGLVDKDGTIK